MLNADGIRAQLRELKVLSGPFKPFNWEASAAEPQQQFLNWLDDAIAAEIPEPHAMTLSSVDAKGHPDARVLILKGVDDSGWHFAVSGKSPKGQQIDASSAVALTFYWQKLGRQVRIRGVAIDMGREVSAKDFLARPEGARAGALMDRQSDILNDTAELDQAMAKQRERLAQNPDLLSPSWIVYAVRPEHIEFWQADANRRHARLRYSRSETGWKKDRLWP